MSCTMTMSPMRSYTRPKPRYQARGDWHARTPWELVDGAYKRGFFSPSTGRTRTAFVERAAGGWRWRVQERNRRGGVELVGLGGAADIKPLARMCFGAADLAAVTR